MKTTLRQIILQIYEEAIIDLKNRIRKKGYVTFEQADEMLSKRLSNFLRYYERFRFDLISDELNSIIVEEYYKRIRAVPRILVRESGKEISEALEITGMYAFDSKALEATYGKLLGRTKSRKGSLQ